MLKKLKKSLEQLLRVFSEKYHWEMEQLSSNDPKWVDPVSYQVGKTDYENGDWENPYPAGTLRHRSWHAGFDRAERTHTMIW